MSTLSLCVPRIPSIALGRAEAFAEFLEQHAWSSPLASPGRLRDAGRCNPSRHSAAAAPCATRPAAQRRYPGTAHSSPGPRRSPALACARPPGRGPVRPTPPWQALRPRSHRPGRRNVRSRPGPPRDRAHIARRRQLLPHPRRSRTSSRPAHHHRPVLRPDPRTAPASRAAGEMPRAALTTPEPAETTRQPAGTRPICGGSCASTKLATISSGSAVPCTQPRR